MKHFRTRHQRQFQHVITIKIYYLERLHIGLLLFSDITDNLRRNEASVRVVLFSFVFYLLKRDKQERDRKQQHINYKLISKNVIYGHDANGQRKSCFHSSRYH